MKKILACLCAAALSVSMAACGNQTSVSDTDAYADATLTGQVLAFKDNTLTLQLGELTTTQPPEAPDQPEGDQASPQSPQEEPSSEEETQTENPADAARTNPESSDDPNADLLNAERKSDRKPKKTFPAPGEGSAPTRETASETDAPTDGAMTSFTPGEETVTLSVAESSLDSLAALEAGDLVQVETDGTGQVTSITKVELTPAPGGGSAQIEQGSAAFTLAADGSYADEAYTSEGDDENALRVDGAAVTLTGITVEKTAGSCSDVESGDFYGMNAALLATNGAQVTIADAKVVSSAQNGNGVFSYGEGTQVTISDSVIETSGDNSGGLQTTGGGVTNANNLSVTTQGSSSAAIRSDRGGGTVNVKEGSYVSNGLNSPTVYSTADITVRDAELTATQSEALVIEGQNAITLTDCVVSGNMSKTQGSSSEINVHNVMLYQSMSGDAEEGVSAFTMTGGSLTGNSGDMFFVTNTSALIELTGVDIQNNDGEGALLRAVGNDASHGWGTAGANGARVTLNAVDQTLTGDIIVDTISTLDLTLSGSSGFTGTIRIEDNAQGGAAVENNAVVTIEADSTWTLTGDCVITSLDNQGTINYNGHTITLADGTVLSA